MKNTTMKNTTMKDAIKTSHNAEDEYDREDLFIDVCKAAVALTLIGMVLYATIL